MVVFIATCIPLTTFYSYMIAMDDNRGKIGLYIFYGFAFNLFTVTGLALAHISIRELYRWFKSNIEKAKNRIKVQPEWRR